MALTLGTNAGFVTEAPTVDPAASGGNLQGNSWAVKDTSPSDAEEITEIGWWLDNDPTNGYLYDIAVYADDGGADPAARIFTQTGIDLGAAANQWVAITGLSISITGSTAYWLAIYGQDNEAVDPILNFFASGGAGYAVKDSGGLPDPWGSSFATDADGIVGIYAIYTGGGGFVSPPGNSTQFLNLLGVGT